MWKRKREDDKVNTRHEAIFSCCSSCCTPLPVNWISREPGWQDEAGVEPVREKRQKEDERKQKKCCKRDKDRRTTSEEEGVERKKVLWNLISTSYVCSPRRRLKERFRPVVQWHCVCRLLLLLQCCCPVESCFCLKRNREKGKERERQLCLSKIVASKSPCLLTQI